MSKDALSAFLTKVAGDAALQAELRTATGVEGDSIRAEDLVSFAAAHGYDFTVEDVRETDLELEESELEGVTGGTAFLSLSGVDGEAKDTDHKKWIDVLSVNSVIRYSSP